MAHNAVHIATKLYVTQKKLIFIRSIISENLSLKMTLLNTEVSYFYHHMRTCFIIRYSNYLYHKYRFKEFADNSTYCSRSSYIVLYPVCLILGFFLFSGFRNSLQQNLPSQLSIYFVFFDKGTWLLK